MKANTGQAVTDFLSAIIEAKSDFLQFIPGLINGLVVLVFGVLLAYILRWLCSSLVRRFIAILPSRITHKSIYQKNIVSFGQAIGKIVFFIIILLTIVTSLNIIGLNVASNWLQNLAKYLPNIIIALAIAFLGWKLKEILSEIIFNSINQTSFKHSRMVSNFISWAVFVISIIVSLEQIGVDMSLVVTMSTVLFGVCAGGIALTFALGAKSSISDILACYQLNRFMKVGQEIEIAGFKGTIESIGPTFVFLETDNGKVTLPVGHFNKEAAVILRKAGK